MKINTRHLKSRNSLILVTMVTVAIAISTFFIGLKYVITTKAASNNSSGMWVSLGMEGVNVGAIAVSPDFASDHILFINSADGIFKSTNAGHTWKKLTNGLPVGNPSYDAYNSSIAISPNYAIDKTIFANTPSSYNLIPNGVYRSQDGGETWERVDVEFGESVVPQIAFSPNYKNDHTIIIGGDGDIPGDGFFAKSTNNGTSWQTLDPLPDYSYWLISDFAFSPNYATDSTIFAGITVGDGISPNNFAVLKSTNGGITWSISIPSNQPGSNTWAVAISPNFTNDHTVFAGTDATNEGFNLIKSTDGGVTWQISSMGVLTDDVQDITIAPNGTLYAGTGGGGTLISTNFGSNWQQLENLPDNNVCGAFYSLALSPQYIKDRTIFAGCSTPSENVSGVWKHILSGQKGPDRDFSLLSPFNNGVTWTVVSGYYNNRNQTETGCHIGLGPDHCRNQLFGLDIVPDQQSDKEVLAPANGKVSFRGKLEGGCIGLRITLDNGLNLNVCHFATWNVSAGDRVLRGKVLGTRNTTHVHLSLDDRYRIGNLCPGQDRCFLPIAFDGQYAIEEISLDPDPNGETVILPYPLCDQRNAICQFKVGFRQYQGLQGISSNIAIP